MAAQATYQVSSPSPFNFRKTEEWPKWIRRFERFRFASGLKDKTEETQVNALLYCMGDEADDILSSFRLTETDSRNYSIVKEHFDAHFVIRRNVIFERAKFKQRKQAQGETVDSFITDLYALSEYCEYGPLTDDFIRDQIVIGLSDLKLSESLQLDSTLTLTKAVERARQSETVRKQQTILHSQGEKDFNVDLVKSKQKTQAKHYKAVSTTSKQNLQPSLAENKTPDQCKWCGVRPAHGFNNCPARNAVCHKCKKRGHYARVCRSTGIRVVSGEEVETPHTEQMFLGEVTSGPQRDKWHIPVIIQGVQMRFKIDTGADVTVIPDNAISQFDNLTLCQTQKRLFGPGQGPLHVKGYFTTNIQVGNKQCKEDIYVVSHLKEALLGRPAIESLGLVARVAQTRESNPEDEFPELFQGLGKLAGEFKYSIRLKEDAVPFSIACPRRVPLPLMQAVQDELTRMIELGVISPVEQPTEWCSGMVVVPKPNGQVRICVDLTQLNQYVCREKYIMPVVEHTLGQLGGAKVFSKLDANSGFWQIELEEKSRPLTTFITPFGRYWFNRLPFGISSAPEVYQRIMSQILSGLKGVAGQTDDTLVFANDVPEHDKRLRDVLIRIRDSGLTLNKEKCLFRRPEIDFLGQEINSEGIRAPQQKILAIQNLPVPQDITELRRFLGMVHYLGKFVPLLAQKTLPLSELLRSSTQWCWGEAQQRSFDQIKADLVSSPTLALYNPKLQTRLTTDASSYGLGGLLEQLQPEGQWKPIAYASKTLTETQGRYSQIEKEGLGIVWACNKFQDFLLGLEFHIITDHKPLVPIFSSKALSDISPRLQRFRMQLMKFSFSISHVPGKDIIVADALSRSPVQTQSHEEEPDWETDIQTYIQTIVDSLPATDRKLTEIKDAQKADPTCVKLVNTAMQGWQQADKKNPLLKGYWQYRMDFSICEGLLMHRSAIVIPDRLRSDILDRIHEGHLGIVKCKQRARDAVWWLGMGKDITAHVLACHLCSKDRLNPTEPLIPSELPTRPWKKVGCDLMDFQGKTYLVVVDFYSRYPELSYLSATTAEDVIGKLKSIFARHGIPEQVMSDNGPQFSANAFRDFARCYGFRHVTSSPGYPRSNGMAEAMVKTMKHLLKKAEDPYTALLTYRATPLEHGISPAELLMGRKLRTTLPVAEEMLAPKSIDHRAFGERDKKIKERQKRNFDDHHGVRDIPPLSIGRQVWIPDVNRYGHIQSQTPYPRSYLVTSGTSTLRRNSTQLRPVPGGIHREVTSNPNTNTNQCTNTNTDNITNTNGTRDSSKLNPVTPPPKEDSVVRSRSGRMIRRPVRLDL